MNCKILFFFHAALFINLCQTVAATYRVPAEFLTIQEALDTASYGDEILVSPGTYIGHFDMKNGVRLIGADASTCIIERDGCMDTPVITCTDCDANTLIAHFTICGAPGNTCTDCCTPSGILCVNSAVRIRNNWIVNHYRLGYDGQFLIEYHGHGVLIFDGAPLIEYNYFYNNRAYRLGAAIYTENAEPVIRHNVFRENQVFNWGPQVKGAGIGIESGAPVISNNIFYKNTIIGNTPNPSGGGIYNFSTAAGLVIENNIFEGNQPDAVNGELAQCRYNCFWDNPVDTTAWGPKNIFSDPRFVNAPSGNFHLEECSPGIDAGNPLSDFSLEPQPGGIAINQGIYGNTAEATISHLTTLVATDTTICMGDTLELDAGTGHSHYTWSNGAQGQTTFIFAAGQYTVTVSNNAACSGTATIKVNTAGHVLPAVSIKADTTIICGGQMVHFSAQATNAGLQPVYQWLVNDSQEGDNSPLFSTRTLADSAVVRCQLTSSETCPETNPVFSNPVVISKLPAYYHPFQNFDDDVDRVKTFSNFFGGNSGAINAYGFNLKYDTFETRTGHGRSLRIAYKPMVSYYMYVESFDRKWYDKNTWLDLNNLFPDFENPDFQNRQIDSIVFYGKLIANDPLVLQVKLEDAKGGGSIINTFVQPSPDWQRFSFALEDFDGDFEPEIAKFIGLNFDKALGQNLYKNGVFYLDDMYLVENCFQKPAFDDANEMLEYLNEVSFRHFWMAVEPVSKFALERHVWHDLISVDAIGYQLAAYVIAHKNGWVNPVRIEERVEHILTYLLDSCRHTSSPLDVIIEPFGYASLNGIWAHFLDYKTLARKDAGTEFNLFSTATLLAGVLTAGSYFNWNDSIVAKAKALYNRTNWKSLRRPDGLMYLGWEPESGYSGSATDWFSEQAELAFLLGISAPDPGFRLPENPYLLSGYRKPLCSDSTYVYSASGSNFSYQSLQLFARFDEASKRFQNTRNALQTDLHYCQKEYAYLGYVPLIFGTTACEGPDSSGITVVSGTDSVNVSNYHQYGYCCQADNGETGNGTIAVSGSGTAILYIPDQTKALWQYYYDTLDEYFWKNYACRFWSPVFGMPDAFHLDPDAAFDPLVNNLGFRGPWLSVPRFGGSVGPMLMNMDSYLSEHSGKSSVRDYFYADSLIAENLAVFKEIQPTELLTPAVLITSNASSICIGEDIIVNSITQYAGDTPAIQWFVNDSLVENGSNATLYLQLDTGVYAVYCVMTSFEHCIAGGEAISNTLTLTVHALPVPEFEPVNPYCAGDTLVLQASGGDSYNWNGPNGFSTNGTPVIVPDISINAAGTYLLTVTSINGCTATASQHVTVYPAPDASIIPDGPIVICKGDSVLLTASGGIEYLWESEGTLSSIQVLTGGNYTVTVTDEKGCTGSASIIVTVNDLPAVVLGDLIPVCVNEQPFMLGSGYPPGGTYTGMGVLISGNIFSPEIAGVGVHTIYYTYTDLSTGCSNTDSKTITVYPLPIVEFVVPFDSIEINDEVVTI